MTPLGILGSVIILGPFFYLVQNKSENKTILYLLLGTFGIRLLFLVFNVIGVRFPLSDTSDIVAFFDVAQAGAESTLFLDFSQSYIWASILGVIYKATGDLVLLPLVINVVLGTLSVMLAYKMVLLFSNRMVPGYVVLSLLGFSPPLIFASASYLRESITIFFITATFYVAASISKSQSVSINQILLLLGSAVIAMVFHGGFFFLVVMAGLILTHKMWVKKKFGVLFFAATLLIIAFLLVINFQIGGSKIGWLLTFDFAIINNRIERAINGGIASDLQWLYDANGLLFALVSSFHFLWAPLFAENLRLFDLARVPYLFIISVALVIIILRCIRIKKGFLFLGYSYFVFVITIFVTIFGFSIFSADIDTAFRHLTKLFPVIIALGYFNPFSKVTRNGQYGLVKKYGA